MRHGRLWPMWALSCAALFGGWTELRGQSADLREPPPQVAGAAAALPPDQWLIRLREGELSPEQVASATALALRAQADEGTQWDPRWGEFVELARQKGGVSDDLWRDYLLGAVRFKVRAATAAKRSAGLQLWVDHQQARTSRHGVSARATGVREDDLSGIPTKPRESLRSDELNLDSMSGHGQGWTEDLTQERYAALQPGPQTYHYRYVIQLLAGNPAKALGERVVEGTIPWRLLAENEAPPLPEMRPDPSLRAALEKSISRHNIFRDENDRTLVKATIQVDYPPTGMGFVMALRARGQTWPLGSVAWAKGLGWSWAFDVDLPEDMHRVDVVLTPSARDVPRLANEFRYQLMGIDAIWDGPEIVIPSVEIHSLRIRMQKIPPLSKTAAFEYALSLIESSDPAAQQMRRDGDTYGARASLEKRIQEHPDDSMAHYELGCILTAEGRLKDAVDRFEQALHPEPAPALRRQIQSQLRRICSMWLQLADSGDPAAMASLGAAYEHGWGVARDIGEAKRLYRNGSNTGHAEAMCRLASLYERKEGATVDTEKADEWYRNQVMYWYRRSADLGNEEAKRWLSTHGN